MGTADAPMGLRERKNLRTEQAIVRAAAELTIEGGYESATIPRIAERADVAPRTVSNWFPVKDEILIGRPSDFVARARSRLEDRDGDTVDRLAAWLAEERDRSPEARDPELERLRNQAIDSDPELRSRTLEGLEALRVLIARSIAQDVSAGADEIGPQMIAGQATALLMTLRTGVGNVDPDDLEQTMRNGLALLRGSLEVLGQQTS